METTTSIDQCAELCDEEPLCLSFEYSKKYEQCKLNHKGNPTTGEPYPNFVFCQRQGGENAKNS